MKNFLLSLITIIFLGLLLFQLPKEAQETKKGPELLQIGQKDKPKYEGPLKFFNYHQSLKTREGDAGPRYTSNYRQHALRKAKSKVNLKKSADIDWIERGPGNVSGRTRSLYVDPRDDSNSTWLAGSAGGGVWRTADAGESWTHLTSDLTSLSTSSIACSDANPDIIYVGTGEGIQGTGPRVGSGIFKSIDNGASFEVLPFTQNNEKIAAVTRLAISQVDPNTVYASTIRSVWDYERTITGFDRQADSYIFKTTDGGVTWDEIFTIENNDIQQLVIDSGDEQIIYATALGLGILQSTNGGSDWDQILDVQNQGIRRIEMAISPTNANVLYAACEAPFEESILYKSVDQGQNWIQVVGKNVQLNTWLGGQGFYNNTLAVHPFNEHIVFLGGQLELLEVNTNVGFTQGTGFSFSQTIAITANIDEAFGIAENVARNFGETTGLTDADLVGVRVNLNQGATQAFRYNGSFEYLDRASIPMKVFNDEGEELALTFVDFNENGIWDYQEDQEVEPVIIYKQPANELLTTAITGGDPFGQAMYVCLATFLNGVDILALPPATFVIERNGVAVLGEVKPIADFLSKYVDDFPDVGANRVHPDHHHLVLIPIDEATGSFYMLDANDGGVAFSRDNGQSFRQTGFYSPFADDVPVNPFKGFNTTQFYGIDKMNGADRYIGGTQDNSVWLSPEDPNETSDWVIAPANDGMETAWHYLDSDLILQTSQEGEIWKSTDRGNSWIRLNLPPNTYPFYTRLANSKQEPDFVCIPSEEGLVKSYDFGETWETVPLPIPAEELDGTATITTRISLADPRVVWSGITLDALAVSEDAANSFNLVNEYEEGILGPITSINTHPFNPNKAYATFSFADGPKVLMTEDLGQSWSDISGFITHDTPESSNGFPDVPTTALLVMPYDTTILWAGTEIGIFESTDSGASWHYADNGLPTLSIWEMKIVNDEVVISSHGRGIWTVGLPELENYEPVTSARFPKLAVDYSFATRLEGSFELLSAFDSTKVILELPDGTKETLASSGANSEPMAETFAFSSTLEIDDVQIGTLTLFTYKAGEEYFSQKDVFLFNVDEATVNGFNIDFEEDVTHFAKQGFVENNLAELSTNGLQSVHPYLTDQNYFSVLKQPILVTNLEESLNFDEIVLVEPGVDLDPNVDQFFDYVSVSATKDFGRTWVQMAKYDAREQQAWLSNFENEVITPDLVFRKNIDIGQHFEIGDTLYLRFDLVTDFSVEGWGWFVDNINYGGSVNTNDTASDISELNLFPNPAEEHVTLNFELEKFAPVDLFIYDIDGKFVQNENFENLPIGLNQIQFTLDDFPSGIYILQLKAGSQYKSIRFTKI